MSCWGSVVSHAASAGRAELALLTFPNTENRMVRRSALARRSHHKVQKRQREKAKQQRRQEKEERRRNKEPGQGEDNDSLVKEYLGITPEPEEPAEDEAEGSAEDEQQAD